MKKKILIMGIISGVLLLLIIAVAAAYFCQQGESGVCVGGGSRSFGWKACRRSFG